MGPVDPNSVGAFLPILIMVVVATGFAAFTLAASHFLGKRVNDPAKLAPYECGLDQASSPRRGQTIRFFLIAMLFLLFDVEMAFLFPWAALVRDFADAGFGTFILIEGLLFLGVLWLLVEPAIPAAGARLAAAAAVPLWRRVLVTYVAAVSEEIIFRLVLLSFVAGVITRLFRMADRTPSRNVAWAANGVFRLRPSMPGSKRSAASSRPC